jgi:hypothetical protein
MESSHPEYARTVFFYSEMERRRIWIAIGISAAVIVLTLAVIGTVIIHRAGPILKSRITQTLSARFNSRVELDRLNVSVLRGLEVAGDGLRIYPTDDIVAAGASRPLIAIQHFVFHSGVFGLFVRPLHVSTVTVNALEIHIPPRQDRKKSAEGEKHKGAISIVVDEIVCTNSRLIIDTVNTKKDPKDFELQRITLRNVGPNAPWHYDATLVNAIPRGDIHARGTFGPWNNESPGDSSVTGSYTFDHADLNAIKGIGGVLSSSGNFKGQLNRIEIDGTTETPDFSLDTAHHPMPLHTQFHAIVDGTTGDTYLQPVNAKLRNSSFTTSGAVINIKGEGHLIDLDVDVPAAHLEDFLDLAVNTRPAVVTGVIGTKTKLRIGPGKESVPQKLSFNGEFTLRNMHFSNRQVQEKVDMLSERAQGRPEEANAGAEVVPSQMTGTFSMDKGVIHFANLRYRLPGARVNLAGVYSLDGEQFDFRGKILTDATLSQMVRSPVLSGLLKIVSPFFKKPYAGAEIPVSISGTRSEPHFGLDILRRR